MNAWSASLKLKVCDLSGFAKPISWAFSQAMAGARGCTKARGEEEMDGWGAGDHFSVHISLLCTFASMAQ